MVFWQGNVIVTIVVTARFMKNAVRRKENLMRDKVLGRMWQEVQDYRKYLVSGKLSAEQIVGEAYQLVVKQKLDYIFANCIYNRLSAQEWEGLTQQENIVDYLYALWMGNDMDLSEEFAEIIYNELNFDMEVHADE